MKELAIIGPTASGKSDLALHLAEAYGGIILSIDSLSVYREIDIASAKPSTEELARVRHFGVNALSPDVPFDVTLCFDIYRRAREAAQNEDVPLIIVGGTSFYLKSLLTGLSPTPAISDATRERAAKLLEDQAAAYALLAAADSEYMARIEPTDRYRTEKMLHLYLESGMTPSAWFAAHPPVPVAPPMPLYEIAVDRAALRERIRLRTEKMLEAGLLEEVRTLEARYGREPNAMKAIGIVEVLEFFDGAVSEEEMFENIVTHTAQLAKRQQTFNRNQFREKRVLEADALYEDAARYLAE